MDSDYQVPGVKRANWQMEILLLESLAYPGWYWEQGANFPLREYLWWAKIFLHNTLVNISHLMWVSSNLFCKDNSNTVVLSFKFQYNEIMMPNIFWDGSTELAWKSCHLVKQSAINNFQWSIGLRMKTVPLKPPNSLRNKIKTKKLHLSFLFTE